MYLKRPKRYFLFLSVLFLGSGACAQKVAPLSPLPTTVQQAWQDRGFYLFAHFGPNTFTDLEWGKGTEKEEVFNPTALDCRQWVRIAKAAGAKGIIITAKHHDGFCLWPTAYSRHTVAQSKWRDGKGDVLQELSDACRAEGFPLGIYLSPWDRNHPTYGTAAYNDVFVHMMEEVTARYGPFFEFWWDGANGEGPNGKKQLYDWRRFEQTLRRVAPQTPVFSDIGPDMRWVGNENGFAGKTNWCLLDTAGFHRGIGAPPTDTLNRGNSNGKNWIPAECDVSIRPGWFYHRKEDSLVKTPQALFQLYLKSVGRGANLLLNVPPDGRGLLTAFDSAALIGFAALRRENFDHSLLEAPAATARTDGKDVKPVLSDGQPTTFALLPKDSALIVRFPVAQPVNCIWLEEPVAMGQRIAAFSLTLRKDGQVVFVGQGTTIGHQRILTFPSRQADEIVLTVTDTKAPALLSGLSVFHIDESLVEQ